MSTTPNRLNRLIAPYPPELADAIAASRLVFRIGTLLEERIDSALSPLGISMRDYLALVLIADSAVEPLRPSDLSTTLDATRTQVTRLIDALEQRGLVQRQPGRDDRRTFALVQTDGGRALLKRATPLVHAAYTATWAPLEAAHTRRVRSLLGKVHAALGGPDAP